jgi:hypothetical protein
MADASTTVKSLRDRLAGAGEDHLGRALSDLLDNPLLTGTIGRAFDAREKAAQAQELAMGALNIPSAADIERLTRRLRSVSQRLEGIEDGVHRLDRALAARGLDSTQVGERLSKIEEQLGTITSRLGERVKPAAQTPAAAAAESSAAKGAAPKPRTARSQRTAAKAGSAKAATAKARAPKRAAKPGVARATKRGSAGRAKS